MSRPDKSPLTKAQMDQLHVLAAMGATRSETAVDRRSPSAGHRLSDLLNGAMISAVLVARGLADSRKKPAQYGEPARTLYWLTAEGQALEGRPMEPSL